MTCVHKERYRKYCVHRQHAKGRGISWELSYIQWSLIWARSSKWKLRGKGRGEYVMARFGDKGPYAPWNVKIILSSENVSEGSLGKKHSTEARARMSVSKMGNTNMLGKKLSAETRAKMSTSHMGKKHSVETRTKMSISQMGNKNGKRNRSRWYNVDGTRKEHI